MQPLSLASRSSCPSASIDSTFATHLGTAKDLIVNRQGVFQALARAHHALQAVIRTRYASFPHSSGPSGIPTETFRSSKIRFETGKNRFVNRRNRPEHSQRCQPAQLKDKQTGDLECRSRAQEPGAEPAEPESQPVQTNRQRVWRAPVSSVSGRRHHQTSSSSWTTRLPICRPRRQSIASGQSPPLAGQKHPDGLMSSGA